MKIIMPNYEHSTLCLINSILKKYNCSNNQSLDSLDKILKEKYQNIVLIVLDGLGNNYLEKYFPKSVFLNNQIDTLTAVYPSTTTNAITSIVSGLPPISHGWLGWSLYFEEVKKTIEVFRNKYVGHEEVVTLDYLKILKYDTIFSKIKDVDCYYLAPEIINNSLDGTTMLKYHSMKDGMKKLVDVLAKENKEKFIYYYNDNPDYLLHTKGVASIKVRRLVRKYEKLICKAMKKAPEDTLFIITSDHGLTDIKDYIYLKDDKDIYKMLKHRPSIEGRACAFFIKDKYLEEFPKVFKEKYSNLFLLKTKEEVLNENILGKGEMHPKVSSFLGDFMAMAISDYAISYGSKTKKRTFKAVHAGLTSMEMLVPLIVLKK